MSGPETGGPPSGPKARVLLDRAGVVLDTAIGHVMAQLAPIAHVMGPNRGEPMRDHGNPHPQPSSPQVPPPPRLRSH